MGIVCTEMKITNTSFSMFVAILNGDAKGRELALSLGVLVGSWTKNVHC